MSDLFWPGDERAGGCFTQEALLAAMVRVEAGWLTELVAAGIVPETARLAHPGPAGLDGLDGLVADADLPDVAAAAEGGGNPVIGLVRLLRGRLADRPEAARWLHRGLTSQDVLDTALVLCLADAVDQVAADLARQAGALASLAREHRGTVMAGRTLTQHAVPTVFGLHAAGWLDGLADATQRLRTARAALPAQVGGAAGTQAAVVQLAAGTPDPVSTARATAAGLARRLGLAVAPPWHTSRGVLTATADALVGCADVWGRIGGDVAVRSRPEIGELAEPVAEGRGGSSTMPHKANPVLSVLLRRHALAAPPQAATLHIAAAAYVDQRPDGGWHAEWDALRTLGRHSVVAASQASELLSGLRVDTERMRRTAEAADGLLAEQHTMAELSGGAAASRLEDYLGTTDALIDAALERAAHVWKDLP